MPRGPSACLVLVVLAACTTGGASRVPGATEAEPSAACEVLSLDEVAGFVGEEVHEGITGGPAGGGNTSTCVWGDADPAVPGRILSLTLRRAGTVGARGMGDATATYDLPQLGEQGLGFQRPNGQVGVRFEVADTLADLTYDVVPVAFLEEGTVDRLARLAGVVHDRLLEAGAGSSKAPG